MKLINGDCIEVMQDLEENGIDTIITDPPYGLNFMGKDWDKFKNGENPAGGNTGRGTPYARNRVAPAFYHYGPEELATLQGFTYQWALQALRVAKPGAMMFCFGGTRTFHRIACGIEDAGWEIRDCMAWVFGSGFPKSYNIGKNVPDEYKEQWNGWGTALKPAWEYIGVFMKPRDGSFVENALKWGVAGLNIDGGRVPTNGEEVTINTWDNGAKPFGNGAGNPYSGRRETKGRWPANLIHDGSEEVALGEAQRFFYTAKASKAERNAGDATNSHPCVKPLSLMEYLCRLSSTPTGGVVLDPFMGSGTTGMACKKTGRDFIGIELDEHYFEIAEKRIASIKQSQLF